MEKTLLQVLHESMKNLYEIGLVDEAVMPKMNLLCATSEDLAYEPSSIIELTPEEIKQLRLREKVSQADFAFYLNTSSYLLLPYSGATEDSSLRSSLRALG